jgi:glycosyltransferase involved in cell wall biosynthesis
MKLLWLTPVHQGSAIARYSELVLPCLIEKGCEVVVAATETNFVPSRRRPFLDLEILSVADCLGDGFDQAFDAIVANFGDHYPNHALSLDVLRFSRLVGIFHDADMTNFSNGMRADGREALGTTGEWPDGREVTASIARLCAGAVAHSSFYRPVIARCDGPIDVIPLAWSLPSGVAEQRKLSLPGGGGGDKAFQVLTFGNINWNKCADRVIEAIGAGPELRDATEYKLVGSIEPEERSRLCGLAERLGVRLVVAGPVNEDELHRAVVEADVVSCLREPVLEGASASAIEAMLHGCAVLVSDAGFYAEIPDECVAKVSEATDVVSIRVALEKLFVDPGERSNMGRRGREYAETVFSPDSYADALLRLIADVRVTSAYDPLIERIAGQLTDLGLSPDDSSIDFVLRGLESMVPVARRASRGKKGISLTAPCARNAEPIAAHAT